MSIRLKIHQTKIFEEGLKCLDFVGPPTGMFICTCVMGK